MHVIFVLQIAITLVHRFYHFQRDWLDLTLAWRVAAIVGSSCLFNKNERAVKLVLSLILFGQCRQLIRLIFGDNRLNQVINFTIHNFI